MLNLAAAQRPKLRHPSQRRPRKLFYVYSPLLYLYMSSQLVYHTWVHLKTLNTRVSKNRYHNHVTGACMSTV